MRSVVYRVAISLDGYIAGPSGEIDWIVPDPTFDFRSIYSRFDTALLGRRTYELTQRPGAPSWPDDWSIFVFSRTLDPADHPSVTVVGANAGAAVADLRAASGRDIWLFGGGDLFASLLAAEVVDEVELAVMPVLLGAGIPFAGPRTSRSSLTLKSFDASPAGVANLRYEVRHTRA